MYFNYLDDELQVSEEQVNISQEEPATEIPQTEVTCVSGEMEQLEQRVRMMLTESKEAAFTQYLLQMQQRIGEQKQQVQKLQEELSDKYKIYQNNMRMRQQAVPQQSQPKVIYVPISQMQQPAPQPFYTQPVQPRYMQPAQPASQPLYTQPVQSPAQPIPPQQPKKSAEFTIGAAVLSIVGSVFILIALVLAGIYLMDGFVKGMALYAACFLVMVLSEIFLYPRWQKLGMTISSVGMGGLYISTLVNYLALENFGMWVALGVTGFITFCVIVLSRKRDAASYRILGMAAVYISVLVGTLSEQIQENGLTQTEFIALMGMMFLINVMCLIVPVRRARTAINITHLSLNTAFTMFALFLAPDQSQWSDFGEQWLFPIFVAVSILIMQLIFVLQVRWKVKQNPEGTLSDHVGICIAYSVSALFYMLMVLMVTWFEEESYPKAVFNEYMLQRLICSGTVLILCMLPFFFLRKRQEKWFSFYFLYLLIFTIYLNSASDWEIAWCTVGLLALIKLLSFFKNPILRTLDAIVTTYACMCVLIDYRETYMLPVIAALVLSVLCINYWKVYFEAVLTFTIALYTAFNMLPMLKLPVFVGILFVGLLIFNHIKRWQGKEILVYNIMVLVGQAVGYLLLMNPVYQNAFLTYMCMLIFGVATVVICFQKKYHLDFRMKHMVLVIFLTYMALVIRTNYAVTNSILVMLIALFSVGLGFAYRKKSVRIYGLVLSLVICGKIVLYDFLGVTMMQKTILFFVVGVLALAISAIYMILEKNEGRKKARQKEQNI